LEAVFAPGAVISQVARQFDVASSMIYKWRHEAMAANNKLAFVPAVVAEPEPVAPASVLTLPVAPAPVAITVEFSNGVRVVVDATAPASLVTATLLALQ
jgi:transposase